MVFPLVKPPNKYQITLRFESWAAFADTCEKFPLRCRQAPNTTPGGTWKSCIHLLHNIVAVALLALKGIYHYWRSFLFVPAGSSKWKPCECLVNLATAWRRSPSVALNLNWFWWASLALPTGPTSCPKKQSEQKGFRGFPSCGFNWLVGADG